MGLDRLWDVILLKMDTFCAHMCSPVNSYKDVKIVRAIVLINVYGKVVKYSTVELVREVLAGTCFPCYPGSILKYSYVL